MQASMRDGYMRRFLQVLFTGGTSVAISVAIWVLSVSAGERIVRAVVSPYPGRQELLTALWTFTLWLSFGIGAWIVSRQKWAVWPTLACTCACAIFVIVFRFAEGPVHGVGNTVWAYTNLLGVPLAVFIISDLTLRSRTLRSRHHGVATEQVSNSGSDPVDLAN